jgi:hypothetical protein
MSCAFLNEHEICFTVTFLAVRRWNALATVESSILAKTTKELNYFLLRAIGTNSFLICFGRHEEEGMIAKIAMLHLQREIFECRIKIILN